MARPNDLPKWATGATYATGPDVGTATKVEPSAGEIADGNVRGTAPTAQKFNWWQNLVGKWVSYFDEQLQPLSGFSALQAIDTTGLTDGDVRIVKGHGVYTLDTASSASEFLPFVVAPTTGPGRWIASHAHQTSLTRWVSASHVTGVTGMASSGPAPAPPSTDPIGFVTVGIAAAFRAGLMRVAVASTSSTDAYGFCIPLDDHLVDGATLASATLSYRPTPRPTPPTQWPRFGIIRAPKGGPYAVFPTALLSSGGGLVQDSGGTYVSDRSLVFTPDQNNVIDLSAYTYTAIFFDEHHTNAVQGNGYHGIELVMTSIPDGRR